MKNLMLMRFIVIAVILLPLAISAAGDKFFQPAEYLHSKLQQNDIVFLGTTHKKPEILSFIAELIPSLEGLGMFHLGLEIPSDQQEKIDLIAQNTGTYSRCYGNPVA
ncbi:hypothetical protein N9934_02560 [Desulfosarcina sp.]|nr:hypothetical protein [Desulfosarcina sp.]